MTGVRRDGDRIILANYDWSITSANMLIET